MRREFPASTLMVAALLVAGLFGGGAQVLLTKEKTAVIDPNDCTLRLFQLLDTSRGGKLTDF